LCALASTWVQTCWFALDGQAPGASARDAYCALLQPLAGQLAGIHLYGLARPSMQPAAPRLSRLSPAELTAFAEEIHEKNGYPGDGFPVIPVVAVNGSNEPIS
jgi:hypothetical protein